MDSVDPMLGFPGEAVMAEASEEFLRPAEAAQLLHVSPQTISRWAKEGRIGYVVTLGGHRRFRASEIHRLAGATVPPQPPA
jgi:excisionase family DNA binding protein